MGKPVAVLALCLGFGAFGVLAASLAAAAASYRAVDLGSLNSSAFAAVDSRLALFITAALLLASVAWRARPVLR